MNFSSAKQQIKKTGESDLGLPDRNKIVSFASTISRVDWNKISSLVSPLLLDRKKSSSLLPSSIVDLSSQGLEKKRSDAEREGES
jgi:hypothetical protein